MTEVDLIMLSMAHKDLKDSLGCYGNIGYISEIAKMNADYMNAIRGIHNGVSTIERPENENATEALEELREYFCIDAEVINSRMFFMEMFTELMDSVSRIESLLSRALGQST